MKFLLLTFLLCTYLQAITLNFQSDHSVKSFYKRPMFESLHKVVLENGTQLTLGKILGRGNFGVVYAIEQIPNAVIKIPHTLEKRPFLKRELPGEKKLRKAKVPVANILSGSSRKGAYLIKERIHGQTAKEIKKHGYTTDMIEQLADLFIKAYDNQLVLDTFKIENFIWDQKRSTFILVDLDLMDEIKNTNTLSIYEWRNAFFSTARQIKLFNSAIVRIKGEHFLANAEKLSTNIQKTDHLCHRNLGFILSNF